MICSNSESSPKYMVESQHVKLPVPGLHPSFLRTGVAEAVTLPANAMAATKEMRDLLNNIVKDV